jgi:hypothetical protein
LFTLKAIEYWDGSRLPKLIGYNEMKLRKNVLFECVNNPTNKIDWRNVFFSKSKVSLFVSLLT